MGTPEGGKGLHWRVREASTRPSGTLFYIHGLGESSLCFDRVMRRSELSSWRHLAPDLPGYGESPPREPELGLSELSEVLLDCLKGAVRIGPTVLVGHSMGGVIGQLVCEKDDGLVNGFVNVEGNISLEDCAFSGPVAAQSAREFAAVGFARLREKVGERGKSSEPERGYQARLGLAAPGQFHLNSVELVELSARETLARRFATLDLPRKLFVAGLNGGLGARSLRLLDEAGVDWVGFRDSGHWPFLDEEDRFTELLRRFLES